MTTEIKKVQNLVDGKFSNEYSPEKIEILITKDGSDYCATFSDFVDLQSSLAGFGYSINEAIIALMQDYQAKILKGE